MQIASIAVTSAVIYGAERENWGNINEGQNELGYLPSVIIIGRLRLKCDGTRAETIFRL